MPSMKTIKRRIASVTTTKKIMKAMNMVAASKLQKDKTRLMAARPFFDETQKLMHGLKGREDIADNVFFERRTVKNVVYLVITGDRGLCGSYNTNVTEKALSHLNAAEADSPTNEKFIVVGLKGYEYFKRREKNVIHRFDDMLETAFYEDAERISRYLSALYTSGEADEVYVVFTQFESVLTHVPLIERILPIDHDLPVGQKAKAIKYDPDLSDYLDYAVPLYLSAYIYRALLESSACEQAARMISMDTAVTNASEIIDKLTRVYNRRRQAAITQEISELVGSASV